MPRVDFVLALDFATKTGWAWGSPGGFIKAGVRRLSPPGSSAQETLLAWAEWLEELIEEKGPALIAYEHPISHSVNVNGADLAKQLHGVLLLVAGRAGVPVRHLYPSALKKHFAGSGKASKKDMIAEARAFARGELDHIIKDDNEADALGMLSWALEVALEEVKNG